MALKINPKYQHGWNLSEREAIKLQQDFSKEIKTAEISLDSIKTVLGLDVAYDKEEKWVAGGAVLIDFQTFEVLEEAFSVQPVSYPYLSGLFSFREMPPLIEAVEKLQSTPDLVVCDGQGMMHPRKFGLACHFGLLFDIPTIGCAKKPIFKLNKNLGAERGSRKDIYLNSEIVGSALRTQSNIKPVYVSVGHRCTLEATETIVFHLCPSYRLPETTRLANEKVNIYLKEKKCCRKINPRFRETSFAQEATDNH